MPTDEGYELVEVPVQKVEVTVTLDDLLDAIARHAGSLASGTEHAEPAVAEQLTQLGQLASRLRGRVSDAVRGTPQDK